MVARKDNKGRALRKGETYRESDNRYSYSYKDIYGKRKFIYAKDLKKLREREAILIKDQLDGLDIYVAGKAKLNFVFDRYISTKTELRETTYTNYVYMYDRFIRDGFGENKIGDIKYSDVLYFYYDLINNKGLQINSLETIHTILHPTFQLAVRDEIIRNNPSDGVMAEIKKKSKDKKKTRHALTVEQQRAFMNYIAESPVYNNWNLIFTVLLGTGCRIGEVVGLRWSDVDLEKRTIDINHSMTYYPRKKDTYKCEFKVSLPKTESGIRVIPMMEPVYEVLKEEYDKRKEEGFCPVVVDGMSGFIFINRFGMIHNPASINRAIRRIYESYNAEEIVKAKKEKREPLLIPHFSCHHLRHTFCSRFCENETNIKVIQQIMGHASVETTMDIYAEINDGKLQESMEALAKNLDVF
ncbi:site-specific integrase [Peptoniphilus lacrimalis]|uniref:Integrase n=1 Tax=Peptoniphilus lacrimalis TaxID=33031 RepID=A0A379C419_9FIRM|nr:site-specific integrase [Peptoniphilus lacrimalis]MDU2584008.1 site-specific integrase [Anaerococcus prevotii]SUB56983.1 Integrase [Peptoniphilus lacrimalis]